MKSQLIAIVAAVLVVGCGESQQSAPPVEVNPVEPVAEVPSPPAVEAKPVKPVVEAAKPEPPTVEAPRISIHKAAEEGNIEAIKQHIAAGTNLNKKDFREGITPLHRAADYGHKQIVELLIANGADVNVGKTLLDNEMKIFYGETPLDRALSVWEDDSPEVKAAKKETAKFLRKHGGKTREELGAEESIHIAARAGHIEAVKKHLTGGVDVNAKQQGSGDTALHNAANGGHKEIVELLIAAGAGVNLMDSWGQVSMHNAANNGHKEIVELLIAKGANVNAKDNVGKTPLDDAEEVWEDDRTEVNTAKKETANLLRKRGGKSGAKDSIHVAATVGNIEIVQQHLDAGVDVNTKNKLGRTPLLYAIQEGHKEIAELLIAKGAIQVPRIRINDAVRQSNIEAIKQHLAAGTNVDERDYDRKSTPLHLAADFGEKEIAELLVSGGANVNAKSGSKTPLDYALSLSHLGREPSPSRKAIATLLRKHGGKTGEELGAEESIHIAARVGHIEAVKKHLTGGVDVNAKQQGSGDTALHNAAKGGHKETVELLIAKGANENAKDKYGWTPLHSPASNGHKEIVELLIDNGADLDAKNIRGVTPLHEAASNGQEEVVELLIAKGADLNAKTGNSKTPLDWAIRFDETETADLLHKHGGKTAEANAVEPVAEAAKPEPPKFLTDILSEKPASKPPTYVTIHDAARRGNIGFVKYYLAKGIDINIQGYFKKYTPLHEAIAGRQLEVVKLLIDEGANVNAKDSMGWTPLDNATGVLNKPKIADLLRKHGGKTKKELEAAELGVSVERLPRISIHDAAGASGRKGNIEAVKQHLAAGTDVDARDRQDKTPLQHAAYWGHKEIAEELIAKGADVNAKDNAGTTTLDWAILGGKKESVELLIVNGVDVNAKSENGFTPLDLASLNKRTEPADLLRKNGGKHGTIHGAAAGGDTKAVKEFLSAGTEVTARDKYGSATPLHFAASGGNKEIAELLIAEGADVNAKDEDGWTPLHLAAEEGHKEIAELLIDKGADVNAKDNDGWIPLHYAALDGHKEVVELLIAEGAVVNAKMEDGDTALDMADGEIADLLRKHGGKTSEELKAEGN